MTIIIVLIFNYFLFLAMSYVLSNADRIRLVELYFKSGSFTEAQRKFSTEKNIKRKSDAPSYRKSEALL